MNRVSVSAHSRRPSSKHEAQKQFVREKTAQLKSENEAARRPPARLAENALADLNIALAERRISIRTQTLDGFSEGLI